jgi:hypothetical protein
VKNKRNIKSVHFGDLKTMKSHEVPNKNDFVFINNDGLNQTLCDGLCNSLLNCFFNKVRKCVGLILRFLMLKL